VHTLESLISGAAEELRRAGISDPLREAYSLMAFAIDREQAFLRAHPEFKLDAAAQDRFIESVGRRSRREPFQHIVGKQEFYGLSFEVSGDVLVPRPETEGIVENALRLYSDATDLFFCDIGTGSGCIAVSILKNHLQARAVASDISLAAVRTAKRNAGRHGVEKRLFLVAMDGLGGILPERQFDLIVANPPYVPAADVEGLQPEVRLFDPLIALTDGANGLSIIRMISQDAPAYLKSGGMLLMEIGFSQADAVLLFFRNENWNSVRILTDLQSIPRIVVARRT